MNNCVNGKCDLPNQTSDNAIRFMKENNQFNGVGIFLHKLENKKEKIMIKDVEYNEGLNFSKKIESCIVYKFIPYGFDGLIDGEKVIFTKEYFDELISFDEYKILNKNEH